MTVLRHNTAIFMFVFCTGQDWWRWAGNGSVLWLCVFQTINIVSRNNKQHSLGRRGQEDLVLKLLSSHLSRNSLDYLIFLHESILGDDVARPGALNTDGHQEQHLGLRRSP